MKTILNNADAIKMLGGLLAAGFGGYYLMAPALEAVAMAMPIEWFI